MAEPFGEVDALLRKLGEPELVNGEGRSHKELPL